MKATWPEVEAALDEGVLDVPVLMLHGEEDPVVPLSVGQEVARRLTNATLRTFPGDLHDVLNEHDRDVVHEVVVDWLAGVRRRPVRAAAGGAAAATRA